MKILIVLAILGIAGYVAAVEITKAFKKDKNGQPLTRKAAAAHVRECLGDYVTQDIPPEWWRILPGMNAAGQIIPADAERDFSRLLGAFRTGYLSNHFRSTRNTYEYVFTVSYFEPDITDPLAKYDYLSALAEADVQAVAHRLYPTTSFPPLTVVALQGSTLAVRIAQNPAGVEEVAEIRAAIRRSLAANSAPKSVPNIEV